MKTKGKGDQDKGVVGKEPKGDTVSQDLVVKLPGEDSSDAVNQAVKAVDLKYGLTR